MESKPGYMTTEFWAMVFAVIGGVLPITGIWDYVSNWHGGIIVIVAVAAYNASRGFAKSGVPYDPEAATRFRLARKNRVAGVSGD